MKKTKLFLLMSLLLFGATRMLGAEAYAVLSGSTLTFSYGTKPSGAYSMNSGTNGPGWYSKASSVTKVVFDASFASARPVSCRQWFYNMTNLTTITGSDYLNTSETTDMYSMFYNCSNLTAVSVSKWNTAKVTNMQSMFYNCGKLSTLAISGWNTANVTTMANMFYGCAGLKSLDLSGWYTSKVTTMVNMFSGCTSLSTLKVNGWNTSKVTDMSYMFYNLPLTSLDLSTFSITSTSVNTTTMLYLKSLTSLSISSSFKNINATACQGIGSKTAPCALTYPSGFTPDKTSSGTGWYMWKGGYFKDGGTTPSGNSKAYAVLSGSTLTFYYDAQSSSRSGTVYGLTTSANSPGWSSKASSVTKVVFDSSFASASPTICYAWFYNMENLTTITGLKYLKTGSVTDMSYMFNGCKKLTSLDLSTFDTKNVTTMIRMFYSNSSLTSINLSSFSTSKTSVFTEMFSGCSKLASIDLSKFTINSSANSSKMFNNCSGLKMLTVPASANNLSSDACTYVGSQTSPCTLIYPSGFTLTKETWGTNGLGINWYKWKGGYFKDDGPEAYAVLNGTTLTYYYDKNKGSRTGTIIEDDLSVLSWYGYGANPESVKKAVFDSSFSNYKPRYCSYWFEDMKNLTTIEGLKYLDTSWAVDMEGMFADCSSLTSIDLSNFETVGVENMDYMFYGCSKLTSLDLSNITLAYTLKPHDAGQVVDEIVMHCDQILYGCTSLKKLILPENFEEVVGEVLDESISYDDVWIKIYDTVGPFLLPEDAFYGVGTKTSPCTLIDPNTVTPHSGVYQYKGGYFIDAGEPAEEKAYAVLSGSTLTFYMDNMYGSRSGTVYDLNTGSNKPAWNAKASTVTKVVFNSSFDKASPTTCYAWFYQMSNLASVTNIKYLHTDNVTNMAYMFSGCSSLSTLDLGTFKTPKVTNMAYMFNGCSKLSSLSLFHSVSESPYGFETYYSYFSTTSATNLRNMFSGCSSLTDLALPGFQITSSKTTTEMLKGCSGLKSLYIDTNLNGLNATALSGVGTAKSPCKVYYNDWSTRPEPSSITPTYFVWKGGYFTNERQGFAELSKDGKTLTFRYDIYDDLSWGGEEVALDLYHLNEEYDFPGWTDKISGVTKVVFEESFKYVRPTSLYSWFGRMVNLTTIQGLSYLNTEYVTTMRETFFNCAKLKTLDLSTFDTSKVGDMNSMFLSCSSLTSLNVSSFNTSHVGDMANMFCQCSSLTSIDVKNFDTSNVDFYIDLYFGPSGFLTHMFADCTSLTSLDLSSFTFNPFSGGPADYDSSTAGLLSGCKNLKKLTIPMTANILLDDACMDVGTKTSPCELVYPSGFKLVKTSSGSGWYQWKSGYFKDANTSTETKAYAVLNGTTLTFYNDANSGSRTGTVYTLNTGSNKPSWNEKASTVTKVEFNSSFSKASPTTCYAWFYQMSNLASVTGIKYLHTDKVTNMAYMFAGCSKLKSLNLNTFDTKNVTTMYRMFYNCSALNELYLYSEGVGMGEFTDYNTTFVTDKATTLQEMFSGCSSLTDLVLADFNLSSSVNTSNMLKGCTSLESLSFNGDMNGLNANACTGVGTASKPCSLINPHDIAEATKTTPTYMVWKSGYFKDGLRDIIIYYQDNVLTFDYGIHYLLGYEFETSTLNTGTGAPDWYDNEDLTIKSVVFTENFKYVRPTSTHLWFGGMSSLTKIEGLKYLNTEYVTDMGYMFSGAKKLTSLDLSTFTIGSSISSKLMLNGCSGLKTLSVPSTAGNLSSDACKGVGTTSAPCQLNYPSGFTPEKTSSGTGWYQWKSGYFKDSGSTPPTPTTGTAYAVLSGSTLTFYYNDNKPSGAYAMNTGTNGPGWYSKASSVTKVVFDASFANARPVSCRQWFYGMTNLTTITGSDYLNTSETTDMYSMFYNCPNLTAVSVGKWNTAKVTNMQSMFYNCSKLSALSINGWDTSNVTTMANMFYNCSGLKTLDLSGWNTAKVTNMATMFYSCSSLTSLNVKGWNTAKVTDMSYMFYNLAALTSLNLSTFSITSTSVNTTTMLYIKGLKNLYISSSFKNLNASACQGIGTKTAPCALSYPSGFTPEKTSSGTGWYMWKGGYFKDGAQETFIKGDVNHDGEVNVVDVMLVVDYTLHKDNAQFHFTEADVNGDGVANVTDVMLIVDITLHKNANTSSQYMFSASDQMSLSGQAGSCTLRLDGPGAYTACQFTLTLPQGCALLDAELANFGGNHQVQTCDLGDGHYNVVVFSSSSELLSHGQLLRFNIGGNYVKGISVSDILLCDPACEGVTIESVSGAATGIDGINADGTYDNLYNIQGIEVKTPQRGVYIHNGRKVVVK